MNLACQENHFKQKSALEQKLKYMYVYDLQSPLKDSGIKTWSGSLISTGEKIPNKNMLSEQPTVATDVTKNFVFCPINAERDGTTS